jgi:hypothetical protein
MILWALTLLTGILKYRHSSPQAHTPRASSTRRAPYNKPLSAGCSYSQNRLALTDLHAGVGRHPSMSGDWEYRTWITE